MLITANMNKNQFYLGVFPTKQTVFVFCKLSSLYMKANKQVLCLFQQANKSNFITKDDAGRVLKCCLKEKQQSRHGESMALAIIKSVMLIDLPRLSRFLILQRSTWQVGSTQLLSNPRNRYAILDTFRFSMTKQRGQHFQILLHLKHVTELQLGTRVPWLGYNTSLLPNKLVGTILSITVTVSDIVTCKVLRASRNVLKRASYQCLPDRVPVKVPVQAIRIVST